MIIFREATEAATIEESTLTGVKLVILIVIVLMILPSVVAVIPVLSIASRTNRHSVEVLLVAPTPPPFSSSSGSGYYQPPFARGQHNTDNEQMGVSDPSPSVGPTKNLVDQASLMGALTIAAGTQITAVGTFRRDIVQPQQKIRLEYFT